MKTCFLIILILILSGLESYGKENSKNKYFGIIEYGTEKITKGANWVKRPEAKQVYEGQIPEGVDEVKTLEVDHFIMFADGEHNPFDINYIILQKGEKIYRKGDEWFAAICGNKLKFWRPVNWYTVVNDTIFVKDTAKVSTNVKITVTSTDSTKTIIATAVAKAGNSTSTAKDSFVVEQPKPFKFETPTNTKTKIKVGKILEYVVEGIAGVIIGYEIYDNWDILFPKKIKPVVPIIPTPITQPPGIPAEPRTMPPGIGINFKFYF